jgi:hypothetical protein
MEPKDKLLAEMAAQGITVGAVFVPWSMSRNKGEKDRSLNWLITLKRNGRDVLTTDYGAGIGRCPSYQQRFGKMTVDEQAAIKYETEHGKAYRGIGPGTSPRSGAAILLDSADVLHSLLLDASVLDAGGFENWAGDYGFDLDSRKAEKMYQACLEIALKLRAGLGDEGIARLNAAAEYY